MEIKEMIAQSFQYGAPTWNAQNAQKRDALVQSMNSDGTAPTAATTTIQSPTTVTTRTNATTPQELLLALENRSSTTSPVQIKAGGYVRKFGKIKRKRKK
jgi:hypothetical protein